MIEIIILIIIKAMKVINNYKIMIQMMISNKNNSNNYNNNDHNSSENVPYIRTIYRKYNALSTHTYIKHLLA